MEDSEPTSETVNTV